jgi:hypothetical protein
LKVPVLKAAVDVGGLDAYLSLWKSGMESEILVESVAVEKVVLIFYVEMKRVAPVLLSWGNQWVVVGQGNLVVLYVDEELEPVVVV